MISLLQSTDDSGRWGTGGVFTALSSRSSLPKEQYEFAGRMKGKQIFANFTSNFDASIARKKVDLFIITLKVLLNHLESCY